MNRITKYLVTLVPLALAALYAGFAVTAGDSGAYNVIDRWIFIGFVLTVIALLGDAADDIINRWHHRHH
jgi:hypothetical protein